LSLTGISKRQTLSEPFIREFQDRVCWEWIFEHQLLSPEFREEFREEFNDRF
jgi:hypothetical protein